MEPFESYCQIGGNRTKYAYAVPITIATPSEQLLCRCSMVYGLCLCRSCQYWKCVWPMVASEFPSNQKFRTRDEVHNKTQNKTPSVNHPCLWIIETYRLYCDTNLIVDIVETVSEYNRRRGKKRIDRTNKFRTIELQSVCNTQICIWRSRNMEQNNNSESIVAFRRIIVVRCDYFRSIEEVVDESTNYHW